MMPLRLAALLLPAALGFVSTAPSVADDLSAAIRSGSIKQVRRALSQGIDLGRHDPASGNTPLHLAALEADASVIRLLLDGAADPNATNGSGATPLHYAATDEQKVRLLLEHKARVDVRSRTGNTALHVAARRPGSLATVRLLLDRGAEPNATNSHGATPLLCAAAAEDIDVVRLLLDRGADVHARPNMDPDGFIWGGGRSALMWAAFRGNVPLIQLLLARGARVNDPTVVGGALAQAAWNHQTAAARVLLEAGAQVRQADFLAHYTPLHWAATSERPSDASLVELLIAHGADVNAEGGQPVDNFLGVAQTPLMIAQRRGRTPIVEALLRAGAKERPVPARSRATAPARAKVEGPTEALLLDALRRAVPPLERTARESVDTFRKHVSRQECISCHQQQLPSFAVRLAGTRGIPTDSAHARRQLELQQQDLRLSVDSDFEPTFHPEPAVSEGYASLVLSAHGVEAGPGAEDFVHQLATTQSADGRWTWNLPRPPIQGSDIGATALAIHVLKHRAIPARARALDAQVRRARTWLAAARPESNEERAYQILGLAWAGESKARRRELSEELIRRQRTDGGWGQLDTLPSDAYATGHSLYALMEGARLPGSHPAVQRGLVFLLNSQLEDGSWLVRTRAFPFQPPMDSGFPHGVDSWISAAGSSWATIAIATSLPARAGSPDNAPAPVASAIGMASQRPSVPSSPAAAAAPAVEFTRDIRPILERSCLACHAGERPKGGYSVETRENLLRGGNRQEPAVVPGQITHGSLLRLVSDLVEDLEMPPLARRERFPALTANEIQRLSAWIQQGAPWPDGVRLTAPPAPASAAAGTKPSGP